MMTNENTTHNGSLTAALPGGGDAIGSFQTSSRTTPISYRRVTFIIMSDPTLSDEAQRRFPVPEYDEIPDDLRERIDEETDRAGFTPNVFAALAYKPSHFRAFMAFHDALVDDTSLDREEVEMIVVAVSGVNHCYYCNVAHGALVRIYAKQPELADQLVANYRQADVSEKRMAMLDVAVKLTKRPTEVSEADLQRLRESATTTRKSGTSEA